jgi:DNA polymerase-3 subunit delta
MRTAARPDLSKAIASNVFEPAYCLWGAEAYVKERAVRQLLARAVDPSTRDFNLDVLHGGDATQEQIHAVLRTPPLMASRRVVVVRDAGSLKKAERAEVRKYLERPAPDVLLVLVMDGDLSKADREAFDNVVAVEFTELTEKEVAAWITDHSRNEFQLTVTPGAAEALHRGFGSELARLHTELDKLASYVHGDVIDEDAVSTVAGQERGHTLADLLDSVATRDAKAALSHIGHVLAQPKTTGVLVVMALSTQMMAIQWGRAKRDGGTSAGRLTGEYYDYLKQVTSPMTARPWGDAVRVWAHAVSRWTPRSIERALDALLQADIALKETRVSSEEQILATTVLTLCQVDAAA